jgi:hypothetical protein
LAPSAALLKLPWIFQLVEPNFRSFEPNVQAHLSAFSSPFVSY